MEVKQAMLLYALTDRAWVGRQTLLEQVEAALKGGVTCVQLREKHLNATDFLVEARQIKERCQVYHVPFIINDNVDIALQCDADGVHVGQSDMPAEQVRQLIGPNKLLGVSVQTIDQAKVAEQAGADYVGVGAVFTTSTKADAVEVTMDELRAISAAIHIPVVAIGGIQENNMMQLAGTGIDGVAMVSAIFSAEQIEEQTRTLYRMARELVKE
ncbi:thiamine phosphate synthase [Atopobacter phocae]|uniref:thiamine phosphate synthase n=1 Tax=Atopobacter phocae TaxID=136492 RepID=UPI00046EEC92|nr:thiamine phosphate synthase [Atopobacter phocae]